MSKFNKLLLVKIENAILHVLKVCFGESVFRKRMN